MLNGLYANRCSKGILRAPQRTERRVTGNSLNTRRRVRFSPQIRRRSVIVSISEQATQIMSGADILVKSLVDHGVKVVFAYP